MSVIKPGTIVAAAIRVPIVLLVLVLFFLLGKSSLKLISAYAVPFGFSTGTTTAFSVAIVFFFAGLSIFTCLYLFKPDTKGNRPGRHVPLKTKDRI